MSYIAGCLELESFCRHYMTSSQEVKSLKKKKTHTHTKKKNPGGYSACLPEAQ